MFDNGGCIYLFLKKPNASSSLASIFDIPFFSFYDTVWSGAHLRYESGMDSRAWIAVPTGATFMRRRILR
jgi:hypothetical protein